MNYYNPNYYMGGNPYAQYTYTSLPQQQQNTMPPVGMAQNNIPQSAPVLNGKIVDGEDVVKATEVPIGGYGVFPKADLSEIYLKTWNNNGTTSVIKFQPVPPTEPTPIKQESGYNELLEKINSIEVKLDNLLTPPQKKKTEVINSGF